MFSIQTTAPPASRLALSTIVGTAAGTVAAVVLGLAHLPLLAIQARLTWGHTHYRFLPLVLLGAAALAARDGGRLGPLSPGPAGGSAWLLGGSWTLLATACLIGSALLGTIAAMGAAVAIAYALGGGRLLRSLLPAWGLLWLAIPPPLRLDDVLVELMQSTATRWSSRTLDMAGVFHLREGNVIRLPDRRLLIEEACSGVHSLFAVLAGTIFLALWARRPLVRGLALVATAMTWVFLGNLLRIVAVVYLAAHWRIDASIGWRHEALGMAVFALALGLTASTDSLLSVTPCVLRLRREWARQRLIGPEGEPPMAEPKPLRSMPTRFPCLSQTRLDSWFLAAAYGATLAAQPFLIGNRLEDHFLPGPLLASRLLALHAAHLPASWGPFQREGFQAIHRDTGHDAGLFSQQWTYRWGHRTVIVSLDGPFQGWRELTQCYTARGWTTRERSVRPGNGREGAFVAVRLEHARDQEGTLFFSHFDEQSNVLEPAPLLPGGQLGFLSELRAYGLSQLRRRTYQFQLFEEGGVRLTPAERSQALSFFERARSSSSSGSAAAAGRSPHERE